MKRAAWYLVAGTVAGFAGVVVLHGRAAPAAQSATSAGAGGGAGPTAASQAGSSAAPSQPSQPARSSPAAAAHSAAGATEQFGYGKLAVKVTVSGSRIVNVTVPVLQTLDPTSQHLSVQAIPMLRSQVLVADGARIDGVSGATFTSQAYANSVQAALDKLNPK